MEPTGTVVSFKDGLLMDYWSEASKWCKENEKDAKDQGIIKKAASYGLKSLKSAATTLKKFIWTQEKNEFLGDQFYGADYLKTLSFGEVEDDDKDKLIVVDENLLNKLLVTVSTHSNVNARKQDYYHCISRWLFFRHQKNGEEKETGLDEDTIKRFRLHPFIIRSYSEVDGIRMMEKIEEIENKAVEFFNNWSQTYAHPTSYWISHLNKNGGTVKVEEKDVDVSKILLDEQKMEDVAKEYESFYSV